MSLIRQAINEIEATEDEIFMLRQENERLKKIELEYQRLMDDSLAHGQKMMQGWMDLLMKGKLNLEPEKPTDKSKDKITLPYTDESGKLRIPTDEEVWHSLQNVRKMIWDWYDKEQNKDKKNLIPELAFGYLTSEHRKRLAQLTDREFYDRVMDFATNRYYKEHGK